MRGPKSWRFTLARSLYSQNAEAEKETQHLSGEVLNKEVIIGEELVHPFSGSPVDFILENVWTG